MPRKKSSSRSSNGNGSIRKITTTRNGKKYTYWQARYTEGFDPGTGKQIQRSITGKTQRDVAQRLRQATLDLEQGTYQEPSSVKVSTGPAQGKEGTKTKPCQTRDFSGHKQYLVAS